MKFERQSVIVKLTLSSHTHTLRATWKSDSIILKGYVDEKYYFLYINNAICDLGTCFGCCHIWQILSLSFLHNFCDGCILKASADDFVPNVSWYVNGTSKPNVILSLAADKIS